MRKEPNYRNPKHLKPYKLKTTVFCSPFYMREQLTAIIVYVIIM